MRLGLRLEPKGCTCWPNKTNKRNKGTKQNGLAGPGQIQTQFPTQNLMGYQNPRDVQRLSLFHLISISQPTLSRSGYQTKNNNNDFILFPSLAAALTKQQT